MYDWETRITIDARIQGGKPVIAGTRVPVYVIVRLLAAGDSVEELCASYGLQPEDVKAAFSYAAETVATEVVHALPHR